MNNLESCVITSPYEKSEECAKFTIDDGSYVFTLANTMIVGREYTFSCWLKSDDAATLVVHDAVFSSTNEWTYCTHTFTAEDKDLSLGFVTDGTYYIYHAQLEIGTKSTDWTPAVEDVDESIFNAKSSAEDAIDRVSKAESLVAQLADQIVMMVSDENGQTTLTQTSTGWTFSLGGLQDTISETQNGLAELQNEIGDTNATVSVLQKAINDIAGTTEYIHVGIYNDQPCIELGESDSKYIVQITNTSVRFLWGTNVPTYIDYTGVVTDNVTIRKELRHGHYVWSERSNGNYGLQWREAND